MSSTTFSHHQPAASSGSWGRNPNRGNNRPPHGGKAPARIMEVRCELCQRRGHKEGDCPSRAVPENAQNSAVQGNQSPQRRRRKEGMNARDRRRVRRQQERQQQQQQHLEETQEENVQLQLQLQQLSRGLEELRGENAQLREVGRQLYLELLDDHLQQNQRPVEEHQDEKEEDGDQYP